MSDSFVISFRPALPIRSLLPWEIASTPLS